MNVEKEAERLAQTILSLQALAPARRAAEARELINSAKGILSAVADAAVVELNRQMPNYASTAETLNLSRAAVNKAITRHNARMRGER